MKNDYEEITIKVPKAIRMREKVADFADENGITFAVALRQLLSEGLANHGVILTDNSWQRDRQSTNYGINGEPLARKERIKLTDAEYIRLLDLCDKWDCDHPAEFFRLVLQRLKGGRLLRRAYRDHVLSEIERDDKQKRQRVVMIGLTFELARRVEYLAKSTNDDVQELFHTILYIDLEELTQID